MQSTNTARRRLVKPEEKTTSHLELRDLANDLEAGTFQLPIVAGSPEATTSLEPEILAALEREALAASRGLETFDGS